MTQNSGILEQTVLAAQAPTNYSLIPNQDSYFGNFKPRLIEFSGAEGEDLRYFLDTLNNFFILSNITSDSRKVIILRTQLRRTAKSYLENTFTAGEGDLANTVTYQQAVDLLKKRYITEELLNRYLCAFNEVIQGPEEHPRTFLGRLEEAADLADLKDKDVQIQIRFQLGLLPEVRKFCIKNGATTFNDYLAKADGWWRAEKPRALNIHDSPFAPREQDQRYVRLENVSQYASNRRRNSVHFEDD